MKLIDQNNNPITDPSTLPAVEAAVADATAAVDESYEAARADAGAVAFADASITYGKNDVPELPAIMGTTSTDEVSDADDKRLCPRDQMVARLRNIMDRLYTYANQSAGRISLVSELLTTAQQLQLAIEMSASLPPDWKPVRTSPTAALAEGVHVFIRSKHRALYQSDLSADDMDDMVVVRAGEKRLRCHCVATGVSIFIPAGHVEVR